MFVCDRCKYFASTTDGWTWQWTCLRSGNLLCDRKITKLDGDGRIKSIDTCMGHVVSIFTPEEFEAILAL